MTDLKLQRTLLVRAEEIQGAISKVKPEGTTAFGGHDRKFKPIQQLFAVWHLRKQ